MPKTITWSATLVVIDCCACGVLFGVPQDLDRLNQEEGPKRSFWCPNGHQQHYTESTVRKLKAQLEREERWRKNAEARATAAQDQARAAERSAAAYKGRVTRLKNRAAAGVCPCCTRHFENLQRHMSSKHPGFTESAEPDDR